MRIIKADTSTLNIGHEGENFATRVIFPSKKWKEIFGTGGTFTLLAQRKNDVAPYPVSISIVDDSVVWDVTNSDTAVAGIGKCELRYYIGNTLAKSQIWMTQVFDSLGEAGEAPEPWQSWVDEVIEAKTDAENAAEQAEEASSHYPIIGLNLNWWVWDVQQEEYVDTGVSAEGEGSNVTVTVNGETFSRDFSGNIDIGTVIREHQSLSAYRTASAQDAIDAGKQDVIVDLESIRSGAQKGSTAYQKPVTNIPKSDLATDVRTSLGKADTALQEHQSLSAYRTSADQDIIDSAKYSSSNPPPYPVSSVNTKTGAVVLDASDIDFSVTQTVADAIALKQDAATAVRSVNGATPSDGEVTLTGSDLYLTDGTTETVYETLVFKQDKPTIKTTMDNVATVNTQYYLGTQSTVSIELPSSNITAGDLITCVFYSGSTATTLSITGTTIGDVVVPKANERIELNILYDGVNWAIVSNAMAVTV